ncbi:MAG: hypothetical protein P4M11_11050 [Candidatus Pacebacteria bacterium]|nr:hypothetical protein [Candidatus Paceibacterota bacterium]
MIDIFYMMLMDTSSQVVESAFQAIESFAQKKAGLLAMNLRERIQQSFAFTYKIFGADLSPVWGGICQYSRYFSLFFQRDRYMYVDAVLELLFDCSEDVLSPYLYQFLLWLLISLDYTESEKVRVAERLEKFLDTNQTLAIESLKQGKRGKKVLNLGVAVARVGIFVDSLRLDRRKHRITTKVTDDSDKENSGAEEIKAPCKVRSKLRTGKPRLEKCEEKLEALEKTINESEEVSAKLCTRLEKVCREVRKAREIGRSDQEDDADNEENEKSVANSNGRGKETRDCEEDRSVRKRKKTGSEVKLSA